MFTNNYIMELEIDPLKGSDNMMTCSDEDFCGAVEEILNLSPEKVELQNLREQNKFLKAELAETKKSIRSIKHFIDMVNISTIGLPGGENILLSREEQDELNKYLLKVEQAKKELLYYKDSLSTKFL